MEHDQADPHFMGAVVLQQVANRVADIETRLVVDGQQRLTTIQLLLDAIQEFCVENEFNMSASRLEALVQNPDAYINGNQNLKLKIWPTDFDQDAFVHAMRDDLDSSGYGDNRIVQAHEYFKGQVTRWLEQEPQSGDPAKAVTALDKAVRDLLELAVIDLNEKDNPHIIFETLNARGTPLLPSDKVKNHILYKANISTGYEEDPIAAEVNRLWGFNEGYWREEIGRGHQRRPRIDIYLNNWLTLRTSTGVRAHREFEGFIDYVGKAEAIQTIQEIAADIARVGELYRAIEECRANDARVALFLRRRRTMVAGVVVPVLLWLLSSDVPEEELLKSVIALDSYLVRRMICGWPARGHDLVFYGLLAELKQAGPSIAGDTVVGFLMNQEAIANKWPTDAELLDAFEKNPLYRWVTVNRVRLILEGIESQLHSPLAEIQDLPGNLQIEHIMPQQWTANWPLPDSDIAEDVAIANRHRLVHTIGNLTLVTGRLNATLSNSSWGTKREALKRHTVLFLNRSLLEFPPDDWDEDVIVERSRKMHASAIKEWPYGPSIGE